MNLKQLEIKLRENESNLDRNKLDYVKLTQEKKELEKIYNEYFK